MDKDYFKTHDAVIYDGDCPFCSRYVKYMRLKKQNIEIINARDHREQFHWLQEQGYNLDDGMVLILKGEIYHGADCINRLALLTSSSGVFNAINKTIFSSKTTSTMLYPFMRCGRSLTLKILGRKKLNHKK